MDLTIVGVLIVSFFATLLSSMSGGGSSIIAIPLFLQMGIPFLLATAIQKVSAIFWVLPASRNYLKQRRVDWQFLILFATIGLLGVLFGIILLIKITERSAQVLIGAIIIAVVAWVFFNKQFGMHKHTPSKLKKQLAYVCAAPIGFYEAIFGSGNGVIFSLVGVKLRGMELTEALGYYFAAAFPWVILAAGILISNGQWNVPYMIAGTIGSVAGGHLGSKFARYKGNAFVKAVFCITGFVLGLKLILGW